MGKCKICGESNYKLLDCHRIVHGKDHGKYRNDNVVVLCSNCHRLIHSEEIIIDKYYFCSDGSKKLHIFKNGKEMFI